MNRAVPTTRARHVAVLATLTLTLVIGAACGRAESDSAPGSQAVEGGIPGGGVAAAPMSMERQRADATAPSEAVTKTSMPQGPVIRGDSVATNMIIRNGFVSIQVDSLEIAMAAVRAMATRLGGYIGNVSTSTGEYAIRSATLEVKVPSARFEEAMTTLGPIGKVEQSNATAEDVGEEFVDLTARMTNARRLEDRLVALLATRTGKLEDVLAVERELARVREEIERHEGRLRFLRSRVALSTLSVTVHEAAPLVNPNPGTSVLGEAVKAMWRNFVTLIAATIASLGVVVPVGAVILLGVWGWKRRRRAAISGAPSR
ncbi:MAG: DUF4349 domain-containing protein [Gemmatimonadaceae bacterium]|nr:DUF4349 domain-containing protein [Gemmatimonadaceae bacterium]